ncbi:MAG: PAS domain S-box protein, partial [Gemmatimonadales bacterium]
TPWAATDAGVAWYDGFQWHAVTADEELSARRPSVLVADPGGGVLVVIHARLYHGDTTRLRPIPLFLGGAEQAVRDVAPLDDGRLLLLVRDLPGAVLYLYESDSLARLRSPSPLPGDEIPRLWRTERGTIWLNAAGGLYRWTAGHWTLVLAAPAPGFRVWRLLGAENGAVLVAIVHPDTMRGLWERSGDGPFRRLTAEGLNELVSLDLGPLGEALAVYETGHVRLRRGGAWTTVEPLPPELRNPAFVKFRKTGDLWVGGRTGLHLYRSSSARWTGRAHPFPDFRNRVNVILRARDGSVWTGTSDGVEVHRSDGTVTWTHTVLGTRLGTVTGLGQDRDGAIWVSSGSSFAGAFRWDGRRWTRVGAAEGLSGRIHRILGDRQHRLWFLGIAPGEPRDAGPGAFLYDGGRFEQWDAKRELGSGQVFAFAQGPDSALWFGTGAGLSRWRSGEWTHWTTPDSTPGRRRGLVTPLEPFVVAVDAKGRTWFGDRMLGLGYVRDDGRLGFLTTQDGLPDNHVWDVQPEDDGGLWIATNGGLAHYRDSVWSRFDPDGGLVIPRIWPVLPLADRVYVGTLGSGLQVLSRAEAADRPPRVVILTPLIDRGVAHMRWRALSYWGAMMRAGLDTRYRVDTGPWTPWSRERSVVLPDLRAGRHTLQVQAKGLFGGFDRAGATAELEIPLPLVLRPQFAVPIGGLTAALVVLGIVAARRKRRAEAIVRDSEERFRMLSEAAFEGIGVNENGVIVEANRRLAEMLGCELRELIGSPVVEFVAPESHALVQSRMVGEGDDRRGPYEHLARRRDGSTFPVEVQGRAVRFRGREARVSAVRDITDRKRAEEALRVSEEKFSKAFRLS